jgi:hypothetical protein
MTTMACRTLQLSLLADLRQVLDGWGDPVAYGVGHDGAVYAAARRSSSEALTESKGIGIFPKSRFDAPTDWLVLRWQDGDLRTVVVPALAVVVSFVQPFGDGVLLVGARCYWRSAGAERNAVAVTWDGRVDRTFTVGDGLQDLRTTPDDRVWASYFDEGVFGNYGWSNPGPPPIGESGLVQFDREGTRTFTFDPEAARTDAICDAYAMSVDADGAVWTCFYTDFPIVRVHEGKYRSWTCGVSGARAMAVRRGRVLLYGDYRERTLGRLVALKGDTARVVEEVLLEGPSGASLEPGVAVGSGEDLFVFNDRMAFALRDW